MTTWARIVQNQAVDIVTTDPADLFHADIAAEFVVVPDGTVTGAATTDGGKTFTAPAAPIAVVLPVILSPLTPMQFYLAFKPVERMKIKALIADGGVPAGSSLFGNSAAIPQDELIAEFWSTYELALQTNDTVKPASPSFQEGLAYLADPTTATTPAVITSDRIPEISAGVAQ